MNTRAVKIAAGALAVLGTVSVLVVLHFSSKPDEPLRPKRPSVNVETLGPGQVVHLDTDALRYFVIRPPTGTIHVVAAPTELGTVLMPEVHWWKPFMNCKDFGLDVDGGVVTSTARFHCRDADQPDKWVKQWQWDLFGKHIPTTGGETIDNMYRVRFEQVGNEIAFTGLEPD